MAKVILSDITSLANQQSAKQALNDNSQAIRDAFENTLSRSGASPNTMLADIDLNGHRLLNVADPVSDFDAVNLRSLASIILTQKLGMPYVNVKSYGAKGDGITNDTDAFINALAIGLPVYVEESLLGYCVDDVPLNHGNELFGDGYGAVLRPFSLNGTILNVIGDDVELSGLNLVAPKATYFNTVPLKASAVLRLNVHDVRIEGGGSPFIGASCQDSIVQRLTVLDYVNNGISFDGVGTARNKIVECNVNGEASTGGGVGIQFLDGKDCMMMNNTVVGSYIFGCYLGSCTASSMIGNKVRNTRLEGLQSTDSNYCDIIGNTASWDAAAGQDYGISLWSTSAVGCRYNTISGNTLVRAGKAGVSLEGTGTWQTSNNKVINNTIINPNWLNEANAGGVQLYGATCNDNLVENNYIYSDNGRMPYGVRDTDEAAVYPTGSQIKANTIIGPVLGKTFKGPTSTESLNGKRLSDSSWTPTVTPEGGAYGTLSNVTGSYYEMEKMVFITVTATVGAIGTATGAMIVTLPFTASGKPGIMVGRDLLIGGRALSGTIETELRIRNYDGTAPVAAGSIVHMSGWYERA